MRNLALLLFVISIASYSCSKEDIENEDISNTQDQLDILGIIGNWKLESRSFNGITSLEIPCCEYIEFLTDSLPNDLSGQFSVSSSLSETQGSFSVDTIQSLVTFNWQENQLIYYFELNQTELYFRHTDNGQDVEEIWNLQN